MRRITEICMCSMVGRLTNDPAVVKWAQDRLAEVRERMNEVESFARIMGS